MIYFIIVGIVLALSVVAGFIAGNAEGRFNLLNCLLIAGAIILFGTATFAVTIYFSFEMIYFIIVGIILTLSVVAGFVAGNTEGRFSLLKRFLLAGTIIFLGIAIFTVATYFFFETLERSLWHFLYTYMVPLSGLNFIEPFLKRDVAYSWVLWCVSGIMLLFVISGLIAFNCRRCVKNSFIAVCACAAVFAFFCFCCLWVFHGLGTFIVIFGSFSSYFPVEKTMIAVVLLMTILSILWTIYSFFGKNFNFKTLLSALGIILGSYALCWVLALLIAIPYAKIEKKHAENQNVIVRRAELNSPPVDMKDLFDKIAAFQEKHAKFGLPMLSEYHWTQNVLYGTLVPRDRREYTLKTFDAPDVHELCKNYEELLGRARKYKDLNYSLLNSVRSYARLRGGRAALFMETKQPEKILPELMKTMVIDNDILNEGSFMISEFVRISCRSIWFQAMVQIGPDSPEYAPVYREALAFMKTRKIHLVAESGYYLGLFSEIKCNSYATFLALPSNYSLVARGLSHNLSLRPKFAALEKKEVFANSNDYYVKCAQQARGSIVIGTTALALKCYRVEHGVYPDKLDKLVPEYLEKNFVCPYTGKPLKYESDGKSFQLSFHSDSSYVRMSSEARY